MSLAKAVVTGIVYKSPKTGYTNNNIAVSSFVLNIGTQDELLIRVISTRKALEDVVSNLKKNQKVIVSGRLQCGTSKTDNGTDKKVFEIDASAIELCGDVNVVETESESDGDVLTFDNNGEETLIDSDEVPF